MQMQTQPMGSHEEQDEKEQHLGSLPISEEETEIAIPEDRYGIACIGCGIEMHLQMIPHRNQDSLLVGWVFCCESESCKSSIIGRRVWFGDGKEAES